MAQDLEVRFNHAIQFENIIEILKIELPNIIGLSYEFEFTLVEILDSKLLDLEGSIEIGEDLNKAYMVCIPEFDVSVGVYPQSILLKPNTSEYKYFSIVVGSSRDPLEYCLAAALALSISKLCNSQIVDGACFWVNHEEMDAEPFLLSVSVSQLEDMGVLQAAERCYNNFNKS